MRRRYRRVEFSRSSDLSHYLHSFRTVQLGVHLGYGWRAVAKNHTSNVDSVFLPEECRCIVAELVGAPLWDAGSVTSTLDCMAIAVDSIVVTRCAFGMMIPNSFRVPRSGVSINAQSAKVLPPPITWIKYVRRQVRSFYERMENTLCLWSNVDEPFDTMVFRLM